MWRVPLLVLAALAAALAAPPLCGDLLSRRSGLQCGVCMEIQNGNDCNLYDACECMGEVRGRPLGCVRAGYCDAAAGEPAPEEFGLRVAKGHGARPYASVRLSLVSASPASPAAPGFFDYSGRFKYRWTENYIHTAVKAVTPGQSTQFTVGNRTVSVRIPRAGDGVAGVLIADPCFRSASITSLVGCEFANRFQTASRSPELLNAFVGSSDTDFWGILGDNFYDREGKASAEFFSKLTQAVKETPLVTVPGNHDYWVLGSPGASSPLDQCGNGHMQFYAQDSEAASRVGPGAAAPPFNYSVAPGENHTLGGCNKASPDNSRFYQQLGNLGIVGQSGAFTLEEYRPFAAEACAWLGAAPGVEVGVIVGHWDIAGMGSQKDMDVPDFFDHVRTLPGCDGLSKAGNLKFFMGHTHCNVPHPHKHTGTGFMVAGQGMEGCGNYGVPVLDTTGGRTRVYYFDTASDATYSSVLECVKAKGWRGCLEHATVWLDQVRSAVQFV